ncbi:hypothetical protein BVY03_02385 [bacterium K02(2017)]|nr:hypothetical protein BVY03_02385 [bacterium K02(2017)]
MQDYLKTHPLVLASIYILSAILIGVILEYIFLRKVKKLTRKTKWEWDDALVDAFHWMPLVWLICIAFYVIEISIKLHHAVITIIDKTLVVILITSITIFVSRMVNGMIRLAAKKAQGVIPATTLFNRTTTIVIFFIGGFIILQNLNIEIAPLLTALGVGGLAVALALQDTLNNLFSGIQIMITRQVKPGDYVRLGTGEEGYVVDIKGRNTTIRSFPDNNMVIVPNSALVSTIVTNYNLPAKRMWVVIPVGVAYDSDLEYVEKVTLEVAKEIGVEFEGGVDSVDPVLIFTEFGDSSINFKVRLFIKDFASHFMVKHQFIKRLHQRYHKENIEIPFPIRTVYHKQAS